MSVNFVIKVTPPEGLLPGQPLSPEKQEKAPERSVVARDAAQVENKVNALVTEALSPQVLVSGFAGDKKASSAQKSSAVPDEVVKCRPEVVALYTAFNAATKAKPNTLKILKLIKDLSEDIVEENVWALRDLEFLRKAIDKECSPLIIKALIDLLKEVNNLGGPYQTIPLLHVLNFVNENRDNLSPERIKYLTEVCVLLINGGSHQTDSKYGTRELTSSGKEIYRSYDQIKKVLKPQFKDLVNACERALPGLSCVIL